MEKKNYAILFKEKKEREIIESVGGEILHFSEYEAIKMVVANLTKEMVEILKKSPKIERIWSNKEDGNTNRSGHSEDTFDIG